jgi:DNA (cytosine-5)-methyltransferase 1
VKIGSLCTGYGGLDMAVEAAFGATTAWTSDIDPGACRIIAERFPDAPNIGDMTAVDWACVQAIYGDVDIITAGYPCQPFSHAGQRKGTDDERHLWPHIREAVRVLRPRYVVLENVAGHRSLGFDRVLGDMAEDGLHARWTSLRAADIGAPHGRERLFILVADPDRAGRGEHGRPVAVRPEHAAAERACDASLTLLPTPAVNDMGAGKTPEWDAWTDRMKAAHHNGNGHGPSLSVEAQRLLPTPSANEPGYTGPLVDEEGRPVEHVMQRTFDPETGRMVQTGLPQAVRHEFGQYAAAITRWEHTLGRPAPAPTEPTGKGGVHRLSPAFVEWMMGLPAGWVTDIDGLSRNAQLKALGNGVVPQQAYAALVDMLGGEAVRPEAAETLLPTPRATDGTKGGPNQRGSSGDLMLPSAVMGMP